MQVGISTASMFMRKNTEQALEWYSNMGVKTAEVFLESFCEYNEEYGKLLNSVKGKVNVHSMHVLTTQYEPQLYSVNERAKSDSFRILDRALDAGKACGAKYYTFHGGARFKKLPMSLNFDRIGKITQDISDACQQKGLTLAYENVHWGYYNYIGFFDEIRKRTNGLKATLDIKQARQSDIPYSKFIDEMNRDIVTVHVSDIGENGKMCLPGAGTTNFDDLFKRLKDVDFNGAVLIEAYQSDFENYEQLFASYEYLKELAYKIF